MAESFSLPYRQIHLDFHTGPWIPDVGAEFDAREFAQIMKRARVNSVTVFAKCHHGHLYFNTSHPARHPGLKPGLGLLEQQVEALHREGIRAPIYISVQCDEFAANNHPEWQARKPDGCLVKFAPDVFKPGWQIMDMSTPYQEYLAEQTRQVLELFKPVDGIFFDMCWDQPSTSRYFIEAMEKAGLNPESEQDRARYARMLAHAYMKRFHSMVKASSPGATVYFNSRPLVNLADEIQYLEQVEIEALPTGGWGYMYFPKNVRFVRTFSRPYLGMTARFHKSWADFGGLKPYAALEYETSQMMAHGARCSIGDQLHPRGMPDPAAYDLIGRVYQRVEEREPWLEGARAATQIGVFQLPTGSTSTVQSTSGTDEGAVRMLTQLKHQFDVVNAASDLEKYELLILPDAVVLDAPLIKRLRRFIARGGALLASGCSGLSPDGKELLLPELAVKPSGPSPFSVTYIRFGREISADVPPADHVIYERGIRMTPAKGATGLARVVEPYFERAWNHFCSHRQTPPDRLSRWWAAAQARRVAYIAYPVFAAYAQHGNYPLRLLVRNILDRLLPEPLLRVDGPVSLEASVMRQDARRRSIVHLLYYTPERKTRDLDIVEDIVPLYDIRISLRAPSVSRVYIAPSGQALPFARENGRVNVSVPQMCGHAMIVFED